MKVYYIDLAGVSSKEELHAAIAAQLPVPEYYGRNLDALHDVLEEDGDDWKVIFYNCKAVDAALPDYTAKLRRMCRHISRERNYPEETSYGSEVIRFYE